MTLEEKIAHLQTSSMEQARAEGNAIIDSHREALEKELADHKTEAMRQSKQRIMEENHLSREQAQRKALYQDRERARLYGFYTGEKWANLDRYDLTVNSSLLGAAGTVELLGQFVALNVMRKRRGQ